MERRLVLQLVRGNGGLLLGEKLCADNYRNQNSVGGGGESVVPGEEKKGRMGKRSDGAVALCLNGVLEGLLASAVLVSSESVTAGTESAYFSCQSKYKALVYF